MAVDSPSSPLLSPERPSFGSRNPKSRSVPQDNSKHSPAHWLASYQSFVRQNSTQISSIETALRSLTYILPGRFHESPLTSETLYTALTLITAWHTHILSPINAKDVHKRLSPQNRYERWCQIAGGKMYSRAAALLRTLQYTQLLCEMFARRAGERVRWRVVVLLELVKAICRLIMMRVTGNRPVIATTIGAENQERIAEEQDDKARESERANGNGAHQEQSTPNLNGHVQESHMNGDPLATDAFDAEKMEYITPRTGLRLPTRLPTPPSSIASSSSTESIQSYLSTHTLTSDDTKSAPRLIRTLTSTRAQMAELLWILRPLVYALALQYVRTTTTTSSSSSTAQQQRWNKRNWTPWLVGVSMELLSFYLSKEDISANLFGGMKGLSVVERDELQRRSGASTLGWWTLRGGFYENITRGWVKGVAGKMKGKLVLDMVGVVVEDYEWLWGEWYFSTATA